MSYQVLARKYRPKNFETLVGQEHVVRALTHALHSGRLHHAYLFTGTRGVGKTTLSRILAKSLNCIGPDGNGGITATPCGVCEACTAIDAGRFVDYIEMDAASNRGVDEMAQLLEQAVYAPSNARFKVYMIDEVHMLTNHAFNSMLKTLEEPPEHVKFILATTDPQKIPVTVLSRCLQFNLKQMPPGHIISHLDNILGQEGIAFEQPALRLLAQGAHGSMRDALSLTDQAIAYAAGAVTLDAVQGMLGALDQSYLIRVLDALAARDGADLLAVADEMATRSLSYNGALQDLGTLLHRIALAQTVPAALPADLPEYADIVRLAAAFEADEVQLYYQIAVHGRNELGLAPDEYAGFSMTLLRMLAFRPGVGGAEAAPSTPVGAPAGARPAAAAAAAARAASAPPARAAAQSMASHAAVLPPAAVVSGAAAAMARSDAAGASAFTSTPARAAASLAQPASSMQPASLAQPASSTQPASSMQPGPSMQPAASMQPAPSMQPAASMQPASGAASGSSVAAVGGSDVASASPASAIAAAAPVAASRPMMAMPAPAPAPVPEYAAPAPVAATAAAAPHAPVSSARAAIDAALQAARAASKQGGRPASPGAAPASPSQAEAPPASAAASVPAAAASFASAAATPPAYASAASQSAAPRSMPPPASASAAAQSSVPRAMPPQASAPSAASSMPAPVAPSAPRSPAPWEDSPPSMSAGGDPAGAAVLEAPARPAVASHMQNTPSAYDTARAQTVPQPFAAASPAASARPPAVQQQAVQQQAVQQQAVQQQAVQQQAVQQQAVQQQAVQQQAVQQAEPEDDLPPWVTEFSDDTAVAQSAPASMTEAAPAAAPPATRPAPAPARAPHAYVITPVPGLDWDGNWPAVAAALPLRGVAQQLAMQAELIDCTLDGNAYVFKVRVPIETWRTPGNVEKLTAALSERFGRAVRVDTELGPVWYTASAEAQAYRAACQQAAEDTIASDPFVNEMIRDFGAFVVPGSIVPPSAAAA